MAFTIYKSTDAGAPSLTGQNGMLTALLDACLVDGYGAKAAAGWTLDYSAANKAVFRAPSGAQLYYRVQDDGPGAGGAKEARITGYETMSDVDTGTGAFPNTTYGCGGVAMYAARKSAAADGTARAWTVMADARTVYAFVLTGDTAGSYMCFSFGEFYSLLPGDAYNGYVCGRTSENSSSLTNDMLMYMCYNMTDYATGTMIARAHTGLGGTIRIGRHGDNALTFSVGQCYPCGYIPFTNPSDGGIYLAPLRIIDPATAPAQGYRGRFRGIWQLVHSVASVTDGDTLTGTGSMAGKTFLFMKFVYGGSNQGLCAMETSDTLETN